MHFAFHVKNGDCNLHWTALVARQPEEIFLPESVSNSYFDFHRPEAVSHPVNYHSWVWSPGFSRFVVTRRTAVDVWSPSKSCSSWHRRRWAKSFTVRCQRSAYVNEPESHGRLARTRARFGRRFYRHIEIEPSNHLPSANWAP